MAQQRLDGGAAQDGQATNYVCEGCGGTMYTSSGFIKCRSCGRVERPCPMCKTCNGFGDLQFVTKKFTMTWERQKCPDCQGTGRVMVGGLLQSKDGV